MDIEFWKQRWQQDQIGFHLNTANPHLVNHWLNLSLMPGSTVFVPLCGKSLDLIWLANQGHHVLGVECSERAVHAFFDENKLPVQVAEYKGYTVYNAGQITLLHGDFFHLDASLLEDVDAVYDRASLIALPESMRSQYAKTLVDVLPPTARVMLITLSYNQSLMSGPPFSVSDEEVRRFYAHRYNISTLHQENILPQESRFEQQGLDYLLESVFLLDPL
jgi:thiopurine S-methyltransferase